MAGPAVPIYRPNQQRDRQVAQVNFRQGSDAASFGAAEGRALQSTGANLVQLANVLTARKQVEEDTEAQSRANAFRDEARRISIDPSEGYFNRTGQQAMGDNLRDYETRLKDARAAGRQGLSGEALRRYDAETERTMGSLLDKGYSHSSTETREHTINENNATIQGDADMALQFWDDEAKFEAHLSDAVQKQRSLAALTGVGPEALAEAERSLVSDLLRAKLVRMADQDPAAADAYLRANAGRISATHQHELTQALQPMIRRQENDRKLAEFMVTPSGQGGGYTAAVRHAESADGKAMKNPYSSATGFYGFLDSTYMQVVERMRDNRSLPAEMRGMTEEQILATRNDAELSGIVHQAWVAENTVLLQNVGAPVNDTSLYVVHHFGQGAGPELMRTLSENPSKTAAQVYRENGWNWDGVVSANPWIKQNMTVGQLVNGAARHIGRGARSAEPEFNAAAAYDYALTIEDPVRREEFLAELEAREALLARRDAAAQGKTINDVTDRFLETGDTNLSMVEQLQLGLDGVLTVTDLFNKHQSGTLVTDPDTFTHLTEMSASSDPAVRAEFLAEGYLEQHVSNLSASDRRFFTEQRARIRAEEAGEVAKVEDRVANPGRYVEIDGPARTNLARIYDAQEGAQTNERKRSRDLYELERRVRDEMEVFIRDNGGRTPSQSDIEDITHGLLLPITGRKTPFFFQAERLQDGDSAPEANVAYGDIPATERRRIADLLSVLYGEAPTDIEAAVTAAYADTVLTQGGLGAQTLPDVADVPFADYTYLGGVKGWPDERIADAWEAYRLQVLRGEINPLETPFTPAER